VDPFTNGGAVVVAFQSKTKIGTYRIATNMRIGANILRMG
jgi:hypothetical protein